MSIAPHPRRDGRHNHRLELSSDHFALPLAFERNDGQAAPEYAAVVRARQLDAAFGSNGVVFPVRGSETPTTTTIALGRDQREQSIDLENGNDVSYRGEPRRLLALRRIGAGMAGQRLRRRRDETGGVHESTPSLSTVNG